MCILYFYIQHTAVGYSIFHLVLYLSIGHSSIHYSLFRNNCLHAFFFQLFDAFYRNAGIGNNVINLV